MNPPYPKVWLDDVGIINIQFAKHAHISVQTMKCVRIAYLRLQSDHSCFLIHADTIRHYDQAAISYIKKDILKLNNCAVAIIAKSMLSRHLADRFMTYHQQGMPTRTFVNEDEARNWLIGCMKNC